MKKVLSVILVVWMALLLHVPAFADVLPPGTFFVTVGDTPVTRYRLERGDDGSEKLVEDGELYPNFSYSVINVVTINGREYGEIQERDVIPEAERQSGRIWGDWRSYYFLLDDLRSPSTVLSAAAPVTQTAAETEAITQTQTQPEQTETALAEETTGSQGSAHTPQRRDLTQTLALCIGGAVVLALTSAVTLTLIHRKRETRQTDDEE